MIIINNITHIFSIRILINYIFILRALEIRPTCDRSATLGPHGYSLINSCYKNIIRPHDFPPSFPWIPIKFIILVVVDRVELKGENVICGSLCWRWPRARLKPTGASRVPCACSGHYLCNAETPRCVQNNIASRIFRKSSFEYKCFLNYQKTLTIFFRSTNKKKKNWPLQDRINLSYTIVWRNEQWWIWVKGGMLPLEISILLIVYYKLELLMLIMWVKKEKVVEKT